MTRQRAWLAALLAMAAAVLLLELGRLPLEVWDESRLAVSALEMARDGLSPVVTYEGRPDHWNTKPPLAIWLMSSAVTLAGPDNGVLRLPSALAALATVAVLAVFCRSLTGGVAIAWLTVGVLLSARGYVHFHAARSGDYDALLTLWTTVLLLSGWRVVEGDRGSRGRWLMLATLAAIGAFMTKSVQGLIFLAPMAVWIALHRERRHLLGDPHLWGAAACLLVAGIGWYAWRESIDPGYLKAALHSDMVGRFATVHERHEAPVWWYLTRVRDFPWLIPGLLAGGWVAWRDRGEHGRLAGWLLACTAGYLLVISLARTKLPWYMIPTCPPVARMFGLAAWRVLRAEPARRWRERAVRHAVPLAVVASLVLIGGNLLRVRHQEAVAQADPLTRYGVALRDSAPLQAAIKALGEPLAQRPLVIVHPGYPNGQGDPWYLAPMRAAVLQLAAYGIEAVLVPPAEADAWTGHPRLACGAGLVARLAKDTPDAARQSMAGCELIGAGGAEGSAPAPLSDGAPRTPTKRPLGRVSQGP